jgi:hypothetical protein
VATERLKKFDINPKKILTKRQGKEPTKAKIKDINS